MAGMVMAGPAMAQTQVVTNMLWEVLVGGTDYMTTASPAERDAYPVRGLFAYVPTTSATGRRVLNRLYYSNGTFFDHMDSDASSEGSYSLEGPLGYPWSSCSAVPGLADLARVGNASTGDHATIIAGDTIPGYGGQDLFFSCAYPRYLLSAEVLNSLTAGGITVKSNSVAGGSIWSWVWNGTEFINHDDYGREMQAAVFFNFTGTTKNPTEAGSTYTYASIPVYARQGSPLIENYNSGNTQITASVPLEWNPDAFGGSITHPVVYADMKIGKEVTLDYNNNPAVAKYLTKVTVGSPISGAQVEIPTAYLTSAFNRFYTYDASSQSRTEVFPNTCNTGTPVVFKPSSGYGGVIISNNDQTRAMGIYGRTTSVSGGVVDQFQLYDFVTCYSTSKWNAARQNFTLNSGLNTFTTYVVTGTLSDVQSNMRQLFLSGT